MGLPTFGARYRFVLRVSVQVFYAIQSVQVFYAMEDVKHTV